MSLTTSAPSGGNVTATLVRTAPTAKMNATLTDAGHYVWKDVTDGNGNVTLSFAQATNQQKLDQLEGAIIAVILSWAKQYNTDSDLAASKATIETENATNYLL